MKVFPPVVGVFADMAVDEGDEVADGQMVCSVESMKVMFPLRAPCSGMVHYLAELGAIVGENEPVFEVVA